MEQDTLRFANYLLSSVAGLESTEQTPFHENVPTHVRKNLAASFQQLYVDGLAFHAIKEPHETRRYLGETLDFKINWKKPWLLDLIAFELEMPDFPSHRTTFEPDGITHALKHLKQLYFKNRSHQWDHGELDFKKGLEIFERLSEDQKQEFLSLIVYSGLALASSGSDLEDTKLKQKYDSFVEAIETSPSMSPSYLLYLVQVEACLGNFASAHSRLSSAIDGGLRYFLTEESSHIWAPQLTHEWIKNNDSSRTDSSKLPWFRPRCINYWSEVCNFLKNVALNGGN